MQASAVVLAAGKGERFKAPVSKLLVRVGGKPVIAYSLLTLSAHPGIKEIILVVSKDNQRSIADQAKAYRINKLKAVVLGGRRRQDSVSSGLAAVDNDADLVLIHDGARPFVDKRMVSDALRQAKLSGAAIVGVPVKPTVKRVKKLPHDGFVIEGTIDRRDLWEAQTPQVFKRELLVRAYKKNGDTDVTDDAMLVEKLGARVGMVLGSYSNIKVTTPEDAVIAEAILKNKRSKK
jgi:2-C-methyl-D-erythritol 4-phosphate cytidylyltransferase